MYYQTRRPEGWYEKSIEKLIEKSKSKKEEYSREENRTPSSNSFE